MINHSEKAKELFLQGYNCSQSVFAAFCDVTGIDFNTALMISSSFGGGMGRMREVCGAVSGMFMVAGALYGYDSPKDNKIKSEHYARIQKLAEVNFSDSKEKTINLRLHRELRNIIKNVHAQSLSVRRLR